MRELIAREKVKIIDEEVERQLQLDQELRIDFGYSQVCGYKRHGNSGTTQVIYNPQLRAFVSRNDRNIHVWSQYDGTQLFKANF